MGVRLNRWWVQQATPIPQTGAKTAFLKDKTPSQGEFRWIIKYNKKGLCKCAKLLDFGGAVVVFPGQ